MILSWSRYHDPFEACHLSIPRRFQFFESKDVKTQGQHQLGSIFCLGVTTQAVDKTTNKQNGTCWCKKYKMVRTTFSDNFSILFWLEPIDIWSRLLIICFLKRGVFRCFLLDAEELMVCLWLEFCFPSVTLSKHKCLQCILHQNKAHKNPKLFHVSK